MRTYPKSAVLTFYFLILISSLAAQGLDVQVSAEAAFVINAETGAILYEKNAHQRYYPASTTKLATALYTVALNEDFLDEKVATVWDDVAFVPTRAKVESNYSHPSHWLETNSTHMGLKVGEEFTVRDLLSGMLILSANDAANVLARYLGGSVLNFVAELNKYLESLGCRDTEFRNPSGSHHPKHMSTAWDLGIIAREALKYPLITEITSSSRFYRCKTNKQDDTYLAAGNQLVRKGKLFYPKCIGLKTGYTSHAKNTFIAAATYQGRTLIAVLLKNQSRQQMFKDAIHIFDTAFAEQAIRQRVISKGVQPFALTLSKAAKTVRATVKDDMLVEYFPSEEPELKAQVEWRSDIELPLRQGEIVGAVALLDHEGREVGRQLLYSDHAVSQAWSAWIAAVWRNYRFLFTLAIFICGLGLSALVWRGQHTA